MTVSKIQPPTTPSNLPQSASSSSAAYDSRMYHSPPQQAGRRTLTRSTAERSGSVPPKSKPTNPPFSRSSRQLIRSGRYPMEAARRFAASGRIVGALCLDRTVGRVSGLQLLAAMGGSMDAGCPHTFSLTSWVWGGIGGSHTRYGAPIQQFFLCISTLCFTDNPVICQRSSCPPLPQLLLHEVISF